MAKSGFIDGFIPEKIKTDIIYYTKARLVVLVICSLGITAVMLSVFYLMTDKVAYGIAIAICGILVLFLLFYLKKTGSIFQVGNAITFVMYLLLTYLIATGSGVTETDNSWYVTVVMLGIMMAGFRSGVFWGVITAGTVAVFYFLQLSGTQFMDLNSDPMEYFVAYFFLIIIMFVLGLIYENNVIKSQQKVIQEQDRSKIKADELLFIIEEIESVMGLVSTCDLSVRIRGDYKGNLNDLKENINDTIDLLSNVIDDTKRSSEKVFENANELSGSAQSLANSTSNQASGLQQISYSMSEIEINAKNNSESASHAQALSNQTLDEVRNGTGRMEVMLKAMKEINDTSSKVANVIKVIDEIAFQTNLLALNAAVEAARAGKYGKGFAVVAEEVRNLARRSSEAAKDTNHLIERSIKEVANGVIDADQVAEVLSKINNSVEKANVLVCDISSASQQQNNSIIEINKGLSQINRSIQTNSAIAEETAAASEELSSHSSQLQAEISAFKLI
ncbi:hypothetical protein KJ966_28600 [bacterium]|nr:hypothetical protein [bacterium]